MSGRITPETVRLIHAMRAQEMPQARVAAVLGISQMFVSKLERGILPKYLSGEPRKLPLCGRHKKAAAGDATASEGER
jgi:hypothetical protein